MSTLTTLFDGIADAIRSKTGESGLIQASNFPSAIANIPTGSHFVVAQYTHIYTNDFTFIRVPELIGKSNFIMLPGPLKSSSVYYSTGVYACYIIGENKGSILSLASYIKCTDPDETNYWADYGVRFDPTDGMIHTLSTNNEINLVVTPFNYSLIIGW